MTPVEPAVVELGPVDKTFRSFVPDQAWLVPPSLDDWLPQDHFAWFIADLVDECLDLSAFYADYTEGRGAPPIDPRLMVRVLLLGYTSAIRSSSKLEAACSDIVAFRWDRLRTGRSQPWQRRWSVCPARQEDAACSADSRESRTSQTVATRR